MTSAVQERFLAKVMPEPMTGCWLWTGAISAKGYGRFGLDGRNRLAHGAGYEILVGPVPDDALMFDHICETKSCVNPAHLQRVTNAENVARHFASQPLERTCKHGHRRIRGKPCRACDREAGRRYEQRQRDAGQRGIANGAKTHCKHGHPFDEANTYVYANGSRQCRSCRREHLRQLRERRRAERSTR